MVVDEVPIGWEDRPFSPANEPPGPWERASARHPFLTGVATGVPILASLLIQTSVERSWWGLAVPVATWLVAFPLVKVWLWREGGRRRRDHDRRVRLAEGPEFRVGGGAARLGG
jgi:hypothetical protein